MSLRKSLRRPDVRRIKTPDDLVPDAVAVLALFGMGLCPDEIALRVYPPLRAGVGYRVVWSPEGLMTGRGKALLGVIQDARQLAQKRAEVLRLCEEIVKSRNVLVQRWLDDGLPAGVHVQIAASIQCPLCAQYTDVVPCVPCTIDRPMFVGHVPESSANEEESDDSRWGPPGSPAKIALLAVREAAGQPLFTRGNEDDNLSLMDEEEI